MCKSRDKPYLIESPITDNAIPIHPSLMSNQSNSLSVRLPNEAVSTCVRLFVSSFHCVVLLSSVKSNYNNWHDYHLEIKKNDTDDVLLEVAADSFLEPSVVSQYSSHYSLFASMGRV